MYYDGTRLLSQKDLNGNTPEIFLVCSNRSDGKTTWFNRYLVKKYLGGYGKFMLIYRYEAEMDNVANAFFGEIGKLFYPEHEYGSEKFMKGAFHELYLDGECCGYSASLNTADKLRRYSHLFADTQRMLMDEFQSESGRYCPNEIAKFMSLHTSVARGGGKQVRYLPVYMCSNAVSILNPYYRALKISTRLNSNVKFLKGTGWVLEQHYNEDVASQQKQSLFNQAFADSDYLAYASQNVYLNDSTAFIEALNEETEYICTIVYDKKRFGIMKTASGLMYCSNRWDASYPVTISVTVNDHNIDQVLVSGGEWIVPNLKYFFNNGLFRFRNMDCKEAVMTLLSV